MKVLICISNMRFLNHYHQLLDKKFVKVIYTKKIFSSKSSDSKNILKFYRNSKISYLIEKWISSYTHFKRVKELHSLTFRKSNFYSYIYTLFGFFSFYCHKLIETFFIKLSFKLASQQLIQIIAKSEIIILSPFNSNDFLIYFLSKKLNKTIFILPDGYDFARKYPIPLCANIYFSFDRITTSLYKKYKVDEKLIMRIKYPFSPKLKRNFTKKISTHQNSKGRKNNIDLYRKLDYSIRNFYKKKINFRTLYPEKISKNDFLKLHKIKEKQKFINNFTLFKNTTNKDIESKKINSNYLEFMSRTSILIIYDVSHAVIEYGLAGIPVLIVYDDQKTNLKSCIKKDTACREMYSVGIRFISFENLKKFRDEKDLINYASINNIKKLIYNDNIDLISYLDQLNNELYRSS